MADSTFGSAWDGKHMASIFERYGGFATLRVVVSDFYDRVLDHEALAPYFEGVDMARMIDHQTKFIAALTGGPASFTDEQLRRAHQKHDITAEHFKIVGDLLAETLEDHGVEAADVAEVMKEVSRRQGFVVGGG